MTDQTDQTDTAEERARAEAAAAYAADGGEPDAVPSEPDADTDAPPADADPGSAAISDDPEARAAADGRTPGQLLVALEAAEHAATERLDDAQRALAELKNVKRRTAAEAARAGEAGAGRLLVQLLDAIDDLDRTAAVAADVDEDPHGIAGGVRAVHQKLHDALRAAGVERVDQTGVDFDANRHEAVQRVDAEEATDEPVVDQVFRPGYVIGDRVLRAAMVVVRQ